MQHYEQPPQRSNSSNAGAMPGKVSVPLPGTNTTQPAYKGGMAKTPAGFGGGLIPGKI